MEAILQRNIRNSEITVAKEKRAFLTYPASEMVPCTLEETEDSVNFVFYTQGMEPSEVILKKPRWEQLRFLVNCAGLANLNLEYDFSLALDNLMLDINLMPRLLIRDAKKPGGSDFLQRFKALAGSVLLSRYRYEDYLHGGQDLYKKDKLLLELAELETIEAVKNLLFGEYQQLMHETNETKRLISKNSVLISRISIPLLTITLLISTVLIVRAAFIDIPFRDSVIAANTAYINNNPLNVQLILRDYDITELSNDTKYILSRSYVMTEALTDIQRENILQGLAQMTDPILFDYWILLGRLRFNEAADLAQRLGDEELLLFTYLKQEVFVRQDTSMPGDERTALLSYLEENINRMNREREEAAIEAIINSN